LIKRLRLTGRGQIRTPHFLCSCTKKTGRARSKRNPLSRPVPVRLYPGYAARIKTGLQQHLPRSAAYAVPVVRTILRRMKLLRKDRRIRQWVRSVNPFRSPHETKKNISGAKRECQKADFFWTVHGPFSLCKSKENGGCICAPCREARLHPAWNDNGADRRNKHSDINSFIIETNIRTYSPKTTRTNRPKYRIVSVMNMNLRIRDLREDNDLSQKNVAEYLICDQSLYSKYERGERPVPLDVLIKLADLYDVSLDYICGRSDKKR